MPDYKYKTSIVIGHRPDGRPIPEVYPGQQQNAL